MFELLLVVIKAIREYYNPKEGSVVLSAYPPRTILEIETGKTFFQSIGDRWAIEIKHISVDQAFKIAQMQYQVKAHIAKIDSTIDDANVVLKARIKSNFYNVLIRLIYDLSKWRYRTGSAKKKYLKYLTEYLRNDTELGFKTFDHILNYNAEIASFFFERPSFDRGSVQLPNRDSWLSIACERRRSGRGNYLQATILEIFAEIVLQHENAEIESIIRKAENNVDPK